MAKHNKRQTPAVRVTSEAQRLREEVEILALRNKKRLLEAASSFVDNVVDLRTPYFDDLSFVPFSVGLDSQVPPNYNILNRGEAVPFYLHEYGLKLYRDASRQLCGFNEFALNALANRVGYIIGEGLTYRAVRRYEDPHTQTNEGGKADALCQAAQDVIDEFLDVNEFSGIEQETMERCDRDGEVFLRLFPQLDGVTLVREIEPEHVKTAYGYTGNERAYTFGIETDPDDIQRIVAYWVMSDPLAGVADERVDAEEIVHIKFNTDRNSKRGLPTFTALRKNFDRADKLLRNASLLAQIRATFALIRKHDGYSVSAVQAFVDSQVDATVSNTLTNRPQNFQLYGPGSVIDIPANSSYEMPSMNTNAAELVEILNAELRAIAARLVMPVWMLTSDASDMGAFTSSLVAESPSVLNFLRVRQKLIRAFGGGCYTGRTGGRTNGVMWRVLEQAVLAGRLPDAVLREVEIQVEGKSLVVRDIDKEAQRDSILHAAGILSPQTWSQQQSLDYDREQINREVHQERVGPALADLPMPGEMIPEEHPHMPGVKMVDPAKAAKQAKQDEEVA
jgi:Phage portal protein, lambda family